MSVGSVCVVLYTNHSHPAEQCITVCSSNGVISGCCRSQRLFRVVSGHSWREHDEDQSTSACMLCQIDDNDSVYVFFVEWTECLNYDMTSAAL